MCTLQSKNNREREKKCVGCNIERCSRCSAAGKRGRALLCVCVCVSLNANKNGVLCVLD